MKDKKIYNLSTDGYGRIVQIIDGILYDGFGNPIGNIANITNQSSIVGATGPQGNIGPQGSQGPQGPAGGGTGSQGPTGPQGLGNQGPTGPQGFQGSTGPQGFQGNQGATGPQGFQGNQGPQGFQGDQGFQGPTGPQGLGNQGPTGPQGFQGSTGPQGFQGNQGATGPQGFQGNQGPQGFQGDQGFQGSTGPQGFQGNQGPTGPQGFQGSTGPQGLQGNQGPTGPQGFQGSTGPQGLQGNQGPTGPQGFQGQGNQGPTGSQGFQGPTGSQGVQGPTSSALPLSGLTAAIATNVFDSKNFNQTWNWSTLGDATGLSLNITSTASTTSTQSVFSVFISGTNSSSSQTTYAAKIINSKTGTSARNVGLFIDAFGGATNYAIQSNGAIALLNGSTSKIQFANSNNIFESASSINMNTNSLTINTNIGTGPMISISSGGLQNFAAGWVNSYSQPYMTLGGYREGTSQWRAYLQYPVIFQNINGDLSLSQNTGLGYSNVFTPTETVRFKVDGSVGIGLTGPNSKLQVNGSLSLPYVGKTQSYVVTSSDYTIDFNGSSLSATLPTAVGVGGRIYNIKNSGTSSILLYATASQTIDGSATQSIGTLTNLQIQSTNTNWIII